MARKKKEAPVEEVKEVVEEVKEEAAEATEEIKEEPKEESKAAESIKATAAEAKEEAKETADKIAKKWNSAEDKTSEFDPLDAEKNKYFSILGYFGLLVLLPLVFAPKSKFARFHANQALVLLIVQLVYWFIAGSIFAIVFLSSKGFAIFLALIFLVASLVFFVMWVQGIANAANEKARNLPFIGTWELLEFDDDDEEDEDE